MQRIVISVTNDLVTDRRVDKISLYLLERGYDVLIIGRRLKSSKDICEGRSKIIRIRLINNKGPLFYAEFNLRLLFILLFTRADIFLAVDLDSLAANYLASKIRRKKLIYDSHEYFTEVPELNGRKFIKSIWLIIEKLILPKVKHSFTVSKSIAKEYNEKYGINMKVVRNFPSLTGVFKNYESNLIPADKKIIIYQGVLNIGRGIEKVIMAMKYIDDAVFLIVGDGDIRNELKEMATKLELTEKVIFLGRVSFGELRSITLKADIGISLEQDISLSYRYSLPNKIFDYIQAIVPVLVSGLPEIVSILEKYDIGMIINDYEEEYLAAKIKEMLGNKEKRNMWKTNLITAAGELCWETEEAVLDEIFAEII